MNLRTAALWCAILGPVMLLAELLGWRVLALRWRGDVTWGDPQPLSRVWWHPIVMMAGMFALFALAEGYHRLCGGAFVCASCLRDWQSWESARSF